MLIDKRKILFVVGPALGHVGRSLVIARALRKMARINVHFACVSPGYGEELLQDEFPITKLFYSERGGRFFADNLERAMMRVGADLVCLDLTPVPWLYQVRFSTVPQVFITNYFLTVLGTEETLQDIWFKENGEVCNRQRQLLGIVPLENGRALYERDLVLLADPPELVSECTQLPPHYVPVGACVWEPLIETPAGLKNTAGFLYISLGSTGNRPLLYEQAEAIARCLGTKRVVWVGTKRIAGGAVSAEFDHQYYKALQASKVLPQASAVVTQGGAGSSYQALNCGVPVIIWPTHRNHRVLGKCIQKNGFGVVLENDWSDGIHGLAARILGVRRNIDRQRVGASSRSAPEKAAGEILNLLGVNSK